MRGSQPAFENLFAEHKVLVYNFLRRTIRDREDADDAFVETFRRVNQGLKRFRGESSEKSWVMRIAVNVAIRAKQQAAKNQTMSLDETADEKGNQWEPADSVQIERVIVDRDFVERMLATLPEQQRNAVWLRVALEQTDEETAEILGVPIGTVKSWVWRSMAKLRKECEAMQIGGVTS